MIKKFKLYKESLLNKMVGPNEDDVFYKAINSYGDEQYKILKGLVKNGHKDVIIELFNNIISISEENGSSLIFDAVDYEQYDILDILLKNGLIPNSDSIFLASSVGEDVIADKLNKYRIERNNVTENKFYHYEDVPSSLFWNFIRISNDLKIKFNFNTSLINSYINSLNNEDYIFYIETKEIEKDDLIFEFENSIVLKKFLKYLTNEEDKFSKLFLGINKNNKLRFGYLIGEKRYVIGNIDYKSIDMKKLEKNINYISDDISISEISRRFKSSLTILNNLKDIIQTYTQHYPDVKVYINVDDNQFSLNVQTDDEDILNSVYLNDVLKSNKVYRLNVEFNLEEIKRGNITIYKITIK